MDKNEFEGTGRWMNDTVADRITVIERKLGIIFGMTIITFVAVITILMIISNG